MTRLAVAIAALAAALLTGWPALAAAPATPSIGLRTGDHPGYGRVVFDLPPGTSADATQDGDRLTVRFAPAGAVTGGASAPRNVRGITTAAGQVEIVLAPGAQIHRMRMDGKLVIDVMDRTATASPAPLPVPPGRAPPPVRPARVTSAPVTSAPVTSAHVAPPPAPHAAAPEAQRSPVTVPLPLDRQGDAVALAGAQSTPDRPAPDRPVPDRPVPDRPASDRPAPDRTAQVARNVMPAARPSPVAVAMPVDRHEPAVAAIGPSSGKEALAAVAVDQQPLPLAAARLPIDPAPPLAGRDDDVTLPATNALAATSTRLPPGAAGRGIFLPFGPGVGAAAFRRGGAAIVVFDARRPIDMAALHADPVFASGTIQLLPGATVLKLDLPAHDGLRLVRSATGWSIVSVPRGDASGAVAPRPIRPEPVDGVMQLQADGPGQVVSMPDPETGGVLLVGTQIRAGQAMPVPRAAPEFALLATWQGVAVEPLSDGLTFSVSKAGFVMGLGVGHQLALAATSVDLKAMADAGYLGRRFDFPPLPLEGLLWRVQSAVDAAAAAPNEARAKARVEVAEALLAAGMGAEAESVLAVAVEKDARLADDPDVIGLSAIAAMLAGRMAEANGIDDPRLTGSDEIALWRAVAAAMRRSGSPRAAPVFAVELPMIEAYPAPLRDRLLPLAAETMALGGEQATAKQLLDARPNDHLLDLARGFLLQEQAFASGGDPKPAMQAYDRMAQSPDRLVRARAATRAVEVRLQAGVLTPAQAADALDKLIYSWRGDARELDLRLRVVELRQQAGQWRPALALLRETEQSWPEQKAALRARMAEILSDALAHDAEHALAPLDLVALADENADLLPDGEAGLALASRLADRLAALDLPGRAAPVLEKLAASATAGPARAAFGGRLAAMRIEQGDAPGALSALAASDAPSLPAALLESRTLTLARAAAAAGEVPRAAAALAALGTAAADGLRAELMENARDWPAATAALRDYAAKTVPPEGPLDDAQARILLRLASAAAQSHDDATLAQLRDRDTPRLPPGKLSEMFRFVTAVPVQGVADLPRAARETKLAGGLSEAVKALAPAAKPASATP